MSLLSVTHQGVTVWIFKQKTEVFPQAAQLQHTELGLGLLCVTEPRFLATLLYAHCIHSELSAKASSFLQGVHLIAVASVSH